MANRVENINSTDEYADMGQEWRILEDMPRFDPEAAARQIGEAETEPSNSMAERDHDLDYVWGNSGDELDEFRESGSLSSLEKSKTHMPKLERILSSPELLKVASQNYLAQYQPESKSRADILFSKDLLDRYVVERLSSDDARDFINSEQFKNYSSYIVTTARQKVLAINGQKYYPELATNPVLSNPAYRRLVISKLYPTSKVDTVTRNLAENEAGYRGFLRAIESRFENCSPVSQGELNMVGDYLYMGRDFSSGLAKKFACYLFNETRQRQDLSLSTQIGGALANYFAYSDTLDDRLKDRRIIIANNYEWDRKNNRPTPVSTGVSTRDYCVLEQNKINNMSLSSEEGLDKSRPETITDLYSLMLVSFHELTHDFQKFMIADGKDNSSAMAYILNQVLRRNQNRCFSKVDKDLNKVLDKNGNEVKTDYYQANHDSDEIEIQADEEAWRQCRKFIHEHEVQYYYGKDDDIGRKHASDHYSKCKENEQEVRARRTFALKINEEGREMPYIQYDIGQLGKSIKDNPSIVKHFPQLSRFFDETGLIKPDIFFNKRLASIDRKDYDTVTDDFGVEVVTYALTDNTSMKSILSYIQDPNNHFSNTQIIRCVSNLDNALHQDILKVRPLDDINFDNYADTKTRGKNASVADLKEYYLGQYLHQLFNCIHMTEILKNKYPHIGGRIEGTEQDFIRHYDELAKDANLSADYPRIIRDRYLRTGNKALRQIAAQL